jgi:hypothetical protein
MENEGEYKVELRISPEVAAQLAHGGGALMLANALELDPSNEEDDARATAANEQMQAAIIRGKQIDAMRLDFVKPAREIIEKAQQNFVPTIEALNSAVAVFKEKLLSWRQGKQKLIDDARRKAEDEQRAMREAEARRAAAAEAERREREREAQQRAAQAAEEQAKAAAQAEADRKRGDPIAAAAAERRARKAAEEQARQREQEEQLRLESDRKAREQQLANTAAAQAARAAADIPAAPILSGFGSRAKWIAELRDGENEDSVKLKIIDAIAGIERVPGNGMVWVKPRLELLPLLGLDMKQANATAKAQEQHTNIPGMTARDDRVATSRTKQ